VTPSTFLQDLKHPRWRWVNRLDDESQEAAIRALRARWAAVDEGAPQSAITVGDELLDEVRRGKLDGSRALAKIEAAGRRFNACHEVACATRVRCPTCGTRVRPDVLQTISPEETRALTRWLRAGKGPDRAAPKGGRR
jgi:ferredoxin